MALCFFTRRLHFKHPHLFLPLLLHLFPSSPSIPSHSLLAYHLSGAFHQTLSLPSRSSLLSVSFSTLQPFPAQNLNDPIDFHDGSFHFDDPEVPGLLQFLELLNKVAHFSSEAEAIAFLDESGIQANKNLVSSAIWALREEWRPAFFAFKWGHKWNCNDEKVCNLMIWVFGSHKKFSSAWCLIRDMHRSSLCTRRAMLIMIDRYASANNSAKAIQTFHFMEKFRLTPNQVAFHALLTALCKNGNIEEAEEFMLVNKKLFPLETEGFNIILNGWCNTSVDVYEAKRVWREMSKYCITPNATSYSYMISCFSKTGNLFDSLRLYDEMKKRDWVPGMEVYNSLVYVLTRENCLKEALNIIDKLKEKGLRPDSATFNSMIRPLCEARKPLEARVILKTMVEENLSPTAETYHAFLEVTDYQGTLEFLSRMKNADVGPNGDSFLIILKKFMKLEQPVNGLKMWTDMKQYEVVPTRVHYSIMVEGLARCKWFMKAREIYEEMIANGFLEDPKLKKLLQEEVLDRFDKQKKQVKKAINDKSLSRKKSSNINWRNH
ncbi:hypothetical protein L6164_004576 [Bauhinia variegata]|uniref:Uncharacterized protein n=1 Tax=Bauhinia variegata TaxID=167791 RepID=A0ACB9Q4U7_BAUVA|nr:hypothetical protein L6164_004576 [Bauhinia variegata]